MKVSYCITCFNRFWQLEQTLHNTFNSVKNDNNIEIILVDFNGKDSDKINNFIIDNFKDEIINKRLFYYKRKYNNFEWNMSIAKSVSHRLASGDILVNLDCDNYLQENDSILIRKLFTENMNILVHMSTYNFDTVKLLKEFGLNINKDNITKKGMDDGDVGRIAISKKNYDKVGGYNEYFNYMGFQDTDFIIRTLLTGVKYVHLKPNQDSNTKTFIPNPKTKMDKIKFRENFNKNKLITKKCIENNDYIVNKSGFIENIEYYECIVL